MPQNLGLVGAEGAASATEFLTRLVAQRRAQEIQDRDYQLQQAKLAEETASRQQAAADLARYRTATLSQGDAQLKLDRERYLGAAPKQQIEHVTVPGTKNGVPGEFDRYVDITSGKTIYESMKPPKSASDNPSEFEGFVQLRNRELQAAGKPALTSDEVRQLHNEYTRGASGQGAIEAMGDQIIKHERPPTTKGINRQTATDVQAYLAEKGFDLAQAEQDWQSQEKYIATMDGQRQISLAQAVLTSKRSLDLVEQFANEWEGGRFAQLNRFELNRAKEGYYGPAATKIATQLDGQIANLVVDLAVVSRQGLSPTDDAMKQAADQLKGEWSGPVLRSMVDLARKNLDIREGSVRAIAPFSFDQARKNPYVRDGKGGGADNKDQLNQTDLVPGQNEPARPIISALAPGGLPPPPPGMGFPQGLPQRSAAPGANFNAASPPPATSAATEEPVSSSPLSGPGPSPNLNAAAPGAPTPNLNATSPRATDRKTISMRELQQAVDLLNQRLRASGQPETSLREQLDAAVAKGYIITGVR